MNLSIELGGYIENHQLGKLYAAPIDGHFDEENIYQPDVLFVSIKRGNSIQK